MSGLVLAALVYFSSAYAKDSKAGNKALSTTVTIPTQRSASSVFTFRTVSTPESCQNLDREDFVEVQKGSKLVTQVKCQSSCDSDDKCYPVKLSAGGFILVDNLHHDSVVTDYFVEKYTDQGNLDKNFKTTFSTTSEDLRAGKPRIKSVEKIEETEQNQGLIGITGYFQLQELDGLPDFERHFCIGEDCVGFDGRASRATLIFDSRGKIVSKKILEKAVLPYSNDQVIAELKVLLKGANGSDRDLEEYKRKLRELTKSPKH